MQRMIGAGTINTRSRNVLNFIPTNFFLIAACCSFCSPVPLGLIINANQIFKLQVNEAITMDTDLLVTSLRGEDNAHRFSCKSLFS